MRPRQLSRHMLEPTPPSHPASPNPPLASASVPAPPRGLLGALGFELTLTCSCEIGSLTRDDLKQLTSELRVWLAREVETVAYDWHVGPAGFDHPYPEYPRGGTGAQVAEYERRCAEWRAAAQAADRARVLARVKPHESAE